MSFEKNWLQLECSCIFASASDSLSSLCRCVNENDFVLGSFGKSVTDGLRRTDEPTDGRADPLMEMCSRI